MFLRVPFLLQEEREEMAGHCHAKCQPTLLAPVLVVLGRELTRCSPEEGVPRLQEDCAVRVILTGRGRQWS